MTGSPNAVEIQLKYQVKRKIYRRNGLILNFSYCSFVKTFSHTGILLENI